MVQYNITLRVSDKIFIKIKQCSQCSIQVFKLQRTLLQTKSSRLPRRGVNGKTNASKCRFNGEPLFAGCLSHKVKIEQNFVSDWNVEFSDKSKEAWGKDTVSGVAPLTAALNSQQKQIHMLRAQATHSIPCLSNSCLLPHLISHGDSHKSFVFMTAYPRIQIDIT